jgi:hypothetical protein
MEIIVAVIFIIVLVVLAMYISLQKREIVEDNNMPIIHTSGIYSVIRKSPRDNVYTAKPSKEEVRAYLASQSKDVEGKPLSETDREKAAADFSARLESSLKAVEEGDKMGVQRFEIRTSPQCAPCRKFAEARYFITREDVYRHPEVLPPFYPGCSCSLVPELEKLFGDDMSHFKVEGGDFSVPSWKNIKKVN